MLGQGRLPHHVPILVAARLLRPLGNPPPNGIKFFATSDLLEHAKDRSWLAKLTNSVNQHWRAKNTRKSGHSITAVPKELPALLVATAT